MSIQNVTNEFRVSATRLILLIVLVAVGWSARAEQSWDLSELPSFKPSAAMPGNIRIFGGSLGGGKLDEGSVIMLWEQGFRKYHPEVAFSNSFITGSEGALAGLTVGVADLAPAADEPQFTDRVIFYNAFHYDPFEVTVATGGYDVRATAWAIGIFLNKENPISKLTLQQLDGIFGSERNGGWQGQLWTSEYARGPEENIRRWGQLGLTGEWANKEIQTYGFTARNSFGFIFQRAVLHSSDKWNPNYRQYVQSMQAPDTSAGKKVLISEAMDELSRNRYGIAWASVRHGQDYPQLKLIALAKTDAGPFVPMTPETIRDRTYPLIRNIQIFINRPPNTAIDPKLKEFLRYALSQEGQKELAAAGYFPLTANAVHEQLGRLD